MAIEISLDYFENVNVQEFSIAGLLQDDGFGECVDTMEVCDKETLEYVNNYIEEFFE